MQPELKKLVSSDVPSLETFQPRGPFGISISLMVGPTGDRGEESFDIMLCTPEWLEQTMSGEVRSGRHYVFVREYNYEKLVEYLRKYLASCQGGSWEEVALKVGRLGQWEFEDDKPYDGSGP